MKRICNDFSRGLVLTLPGERPPPPPPPPGARVRVLP